MIKGFSKAKWKKWMWTPLRESICPKDTKNHKGEERIPRTFPDPDRKDDPGEKNDVYIGKIQLITKAAMILTFKYFIFISMLL